MAMENKDKPKWREFWVFPEHNKVSNYFTRIGTPANAVEPVHVIEHAALAEAERTIAELRDELLRFKDGIPQKGNSHVTCPCCGTISVRTLEDYKGITIYTVKCENKECGHSYLPETQENKCLYQDIKLLTAERDQLTKRIGELEGLCDEMARDLVGRHSRCILKENVCPTCKLFSKYNELSPDQKE